MFRTIASIGALQTAQAFSSFPDGSNGGKKIAAMDPNGHGGGKGLFDCSDFLTTDSIKFYTADLALDCQVVLNGTDATAAQKAGLCGADAQGKAYLVRGKKANATHHEWMSSVTWSGACLPPSPTCTIAGQSYGNKVLGMHVHEGDAEQNGPVRIVFCGSGTPLGGLMRKGDEGAEPIGPCPQQSPGHVTGDSCVSPDPPCTSEGLGLKEDKPVYFNLHTEWSLALTHGNGAIRGQMVQSKESFCK